MEALEEKIKNVINFRDHYFMEHPQSNTAEKTKAVREMVLPLLQDIPLEIRGSSSSSAEYNFICGRILNIPSEYDAKCEKHLTNAVKMDPSLRDAWEELGECLWKKNDYQTAIDCFRASLARGRTAKCVCALSMALRQHSSKIEDQNQQAAMRAEAAKLCEEAVELDPKNGHAWHTLGNALLIQHFSTAQRDDQLMVKAKEAYEKALILGDEYRNPDLHLNYGTALKYCQDYSRCLDHFRTACEYDPSFTSAKENLHALSSFLIRLNEAVERKGKLKAKRLAEYQKSLHSSDLGIYQEGSCFPKGIQFAKFKEITCASLKEGSNPGTVFCGKVVGIVSNSEGVPFSFVGCDKDGTCVAFAVYNCSQEFGIIIGDSFAVPSPFVIDVKIDKVSDVYLSKERAIAFRLVRINNPIGMMKNGRPLPQNYLAMCDMRCSYV